MEATSASCLVVMVARASRTSSRALRCSENATNAWLATQPATPASTGPVMLATIVRMRAHAMTVGWEARVTTLLSRPSPSWCATLLTLLGLLDGLDRLSCLAAGARVPGAAGLRRHGAGPVELRLL